MEARPFTDKQCSPDEAALKKTFDGTYALYVKLMALASAFRSEWFFSKSSGWAQKVYDSKKALFYIVPLFKSFKVSLAIREQERILLLNDAALREIHDQLQSAKKYSEGYALQFLITDTGTYTTVETFMCKLIALRK